ncbi:MAG: TolC family protein [Leptospiraceae bacterium]|nr:TolC family protein [Leptospiraceae bacterium]
MLVFISFNYLESQVYINLDSAIEYGIKANSILRVLNSKKEISHLLEKEKWRDYLPKLSINYLGLRGLNQNQQDSIYNDLRLSFQQMIYDGGENSRAIDIAKFSGFLSDSEFKIQAKKLKYEIQKSYLKLLTLQGKFFFFKRTLDKAKFILNETKIARSKNLKTEKDVLDAEWRLAGIEHSYLKIKIEKEHALKELKMLTLLESENFILEEDLFLDFILEKPNISEEAEPKNSSDWKRSRIILEKAKTEKENSENFWKPKFFVGGYVGKNSNEIGPLKNENYGWNFSLSLPLGSSSSKTDGNIGTQTDGTGIQRIPGFGPQFVGQGENSYLSSSIGILDNMSVKRKIFEGELNYEEALANHLNLERQLELEKNTVMNRLNETYSLIHVSNLKLKRDSKNLKLIQSKYKLGLGTLSELISAEAEFLQSIDELGMNIFEFSKSNFELERILENSNITFFKYKKGKGNSILRDLIEMDGKIK